MSHLWTGGYPRNTSNGDYGRFLFASNQNSSNNNQGNFTVYPSADGNRMVHHAHYPNCPNRQNGNGQPKVTGGGGSTGMPEYTIEYGEDAVRAALGGNMPDFQAQFMQQMNNGANQSSNGVAVDPQQIQMMNNGKSRVAMIPVVFDNGGGDDDDQQQSNEGSAESMKASVGGSGNNSNSSGQESNANVPQTSDGGIARAQAQSVKPPKKESIIDAYNSVRKVRSTGQVKYGRHIRPSYFNPQVPNPCRKKMGGGDFLPELPKCSDEPQGMPAMPPASDMNIADGNGMKVMMMENSNNNNCYTTPPKNLPQPYGMQQGVQPPPQRARSMPLKKHSRPTNSLCGKCTKCKNLSSNQNLGEPQVMTFPAYSPGTRRSVGSRNLTSSNLGQSAKNFRAIRFSST
ncbi:hypothetical protein Ocin01_04023 [Orchesella cincta]|uniref:Uncharacterized protein n=1 Tax=Orchesella cincta TaxID=48709 RepID=A0A1D2NCD9_ORCCI|nr:hypothetical protein Ocin01_04023 [Orchesella cincta]